MFSSIQELSEKLEAAKYVTDPVTLKVIYLAAQMQKPVLAEGPPGSGKTELAKVVALAADTSIERLQCCEGSSPDWRSAAARSLYLRFEHPTIERETQILERRTAGTHAELHGQLAGFAHAVRGYTLEKAPSIAEMLDLAEALKVLGVHEISADLRDVLLPLIAETQNDRKRLLLRDGFESLVYDTQQYSRERGQAAIDQKELVCAERRRY